MTKQIVLDASALIASIYEENGAEKVDSYLPQAMISAVNLTEVASYMVREGMPMDDACELLKDLSLNVVDYNEDQALTAARLLPKTSAKGLSLGDRACLALAITQKLPVLTGDKAWKSLDIDVDVNIFR